MKQNVRYVRRKDVHDDRDHKYSLLKADLNDGDLPSRADTNGMDGVYWPPVWNQGPLGSCTAFSSCGAAAYHFIKLQKEVPSEFSELFQYYNERVIGGQDVSVDDGSTIRNAMKSLAKYGVPPEQDWAYVVSNFDDKPPKSAYQDALGYMIADYQSVDQNLDHIRQAISTGFPVVIGIQVYQSFETAVNGKIPMPAPNEKLLGGHAIVLTSYDDSKQVFGFRNSWGSDWGQDGYGTLPYQYVLDQKLTEDLWIIGSESVPGSVPSGGFLSWLYNLIRKIFGF